jgi:RNA recognition motif-containing protein
MSSFEIRITNLSWKATEADIRDFVSTFAKVKEVKLILDFQKRSKGSEHLN